MKIVIFYYLKASAVWPDKKGGIWWEWPFKKGGGLMYMTIFQLIIDFFFFAAYILWKLCICLVWSWKDMSYVPNADTCRKSTVERWINKCPHTVVLKSAIISWADRRKPPFCQICFIPITALVFHSIIHVFEFWIKHI